MCTQKIITIHYGNGKAHRLLCEFYVMNSWNLMEEKYILNQAYVHKEHKDFNYHCFLFLHKINKIKFKFKN